MSLKTLIVIPVKDFASAKSRLRPVLGDRHRSQLARRLCERTLSFFQQHFPEYPLLVVTASAAIGELARGHGASVLRELRPAGLSGAAALAAHWSKKHGFDSQLLVPADIARLDADEFRTLLRQPRSAPSVLICPASDAGTNALLTTPPDVVPFCFGPNSSEAHQAAALKRSLPCELLQFDHMRFDLDTPEDLHSLMHQHSGDLPRELVTLWNL